MPGRRWKEEDRGRSREDTSAAGDRMQREERAQVSGRVLRAGELAGAARIWGLAWHPRPKRRLRPGERGAEVRRGPEDQDREGLLLNSDRMLQKGFEQRRKILILGHREVVSFFSPCCSCFSEPKQKINIAESS